MDNRWVIIVALAASIPLILIIFSLMPTTPTSSPSTTNLENCNELEVNSESGINIVFFSDEVEAIKYKDFFKETPPYDEYKNSFNFYYIDNYKPKCELYKGIATFCHSRELIKKGASCPNDFLIVLDEQPPNIRSSAYQNVLSINKNHKLTVLTHEFGHSFANLAEEYTPAKVPKGTENCVTSCDDFTTETNGCFKGCSDTDYYRSISNGVMKTLNSNEYGIFNENLIIKLITKQAPTTPTTIAGKVVLTTETCNNNQYYLLEGLYNEDSIDSIEINRTTLETGCLGGNGAGTFIYEIKTAAGTTLTQSDFNPELIFTDAEGIDEIEGEPLTSDQPFLLKIPIISQADKLTISESGNTLIEIRLNDIGAKACKI